MKSTSIALVLMASDAAASACSVGGEGLCSCSELTRAGAITDFDKCTQGVAMQACEDGLCTHEARTYAASASDCSVGGEGLCSCSELIRSGAIESFDDCTQGAAVEACVAGVCSHDDDASTLRSQKQRRVASLLADLAPLPFYFEDPFGELRLSWGFDNSSKIEIEMTLPSDYYIGLGFDPVGEGDVVAGWIDHENGRAVIGDYWDLGRREPETDESRGCRNDVEVVGGAYSRYETTIRFKRKLVTGDRRDCDMDIVKGPMTINYAYCDAPWCFDGFASNGGCNAFEAGCIDSAHSGSAAASYVEIDFSGARSFL